jgi:hypothetical protein
MGANHEHGCHINIRITSQGDVNIYNCTPPAQAPAQEPTPPTAALPVSPGACVPLALGVKPKQSQQRKIEKALAGTPIPSAFAAAFLHAGRRFLAGRQAANPLETEIFDRLQAFSPTLKAILACALEQFDALPPADRNRLVDVQAIGDDATPLDAASLGTALAAEISKRASVLAFGHDCLTEEPGKVRVFDPGFAEIFESQVKICRINGLRTGQFAPPLAPGEYTIDELQQECVPAVVNGELQVTCAVQQHNCPGHALFDGTCLRVPEVEAGQVVTLEGVNFFSVDATVRLRPKDSTEDPRVVDAHVCGDQDTPVSETVNGVTRFIADCRVHDRLTFAVPGDLVPGIYEIVVSVPNITGIAVFGAAIMSTPEYLAVMPASTARYRIEATKLFAHEETSPAFFGSDEVAVRFLTAGLLADGTWCQLEHVESLHGDVDSGEERAMSCILLPDYDQPLAAVSIAILGHEVDNYPTYLAQVEGFTDGYIDILKRLWKIEAIGTGALTALALLAGASLPVSALVAAVMVAIFAAVNFFLALWAPADLIMQDVVMLSGAQLAALTNDNAPAPAPAEYVTTSDIDVSVAPVSKGGSEYLESRTYDCEDEGSRYEIRIRYSRVA